MRHTGTDRAYRSERAGKYLRAAVELDPRFDDIANTGNSNRLAGANDRKSRALNARIADNKPHKVLLVQFQQSVLITIRAAKTKLTNWKLCHLKAHRFAVE
jgi:hypothetical protein